MKHKLTIFLWSTYIVLILILALSPDNPDFLNLSLKKPWILQHILAFVVFILLTRITFPKLKWYWLVLIGLGFGLSIELLQLWLTGGVREFSLLDLGYDAVGIFVGIALCIVGKIVNSE